MMSEGANIYQRMLKVMADCPAVAKTKGKFELFPTVKHDDVTSALHSVLIENGILPVVDMLEMTVSEPWEHTGKGGTKTYTRTDIKARVTFVNVDNPEDVVAVHSYGTGIDDQDKGVGKATSYSVKYALLKAFNMQTGDDADNDQENRGAPPAQSRGNGGGKQSAPAAQGDDTRPPLPADGSISEPKRRRLWKLSQEAGMSEDDLKAIVKEHADTDSTKTIHWKKYDAVCNAVQAWVAAPEGGAPAAEDDDLGF